MRYRSGRGTIIFCVSAGLQIAPDVNRFRWFRSSNSGQRRGMWLHISIAINGLASFGERRWVAGMSTEGKVQAAKPPKPAASTYPVPATLENAHRLVRQSHKALTGDTYVDNGVVNSRTHHPLSISVSPEQVNRACRILDAIIKAITAQG